MSNELRAKYLPSKVVNNNIMRDDEKLIHLMKTDPHSTAKFIHMAFEHRETTLDVLYTIQDLTTDVVNLSKKSSQERNSMYEIKHVSDNGLKILLRKIQS